MKKGFFAILFSSLIHGTLFYIPDLFEPRPIERIVASRSIPIRLLRPRPSSKHTLTKPVIPRPLSKTNLKPPKPPSATPAAPSPPLQKTLSTPKLRPRSQMKTGRPKQLSPQAASPPAARNRPAETIETPKPVSAEVEEAPPPGPVLRPFRALKGGYQVMPVYPMAARREKREGEVLLKVEILESGGIGNLEVLRSSQSADLDAAAIEAVKQWRFDPAMRNGVPVQQITLLPIRFSLRAD
ncbi:MAG: energy transducer TonB [Nitrospiria bacterium]